MKKMLDYDMSINYFPFISVSSLGYFMQKKTYSLYQKKIYFILFFVIEISY